MPSITWTNLQFESFKTCITLQSTRKHASLSFVSSVNRDSNLDTITIDPHENRLPNTIEALGPESHQAWPHGQCSLETWRKKHGKTWETTRSPMKLRKADKFLMILYLVHLENECFFFWRCLYTIYEKHTTMDNGNPFVSWRLLFLLKFYSGLNLKFQLFFGVKKTSGEQFASKNPKGVAPLWPTLSRWNTRNLECWKNHEIFQWSDSMRCKNPKGNWWNWLMSRQMIARKKDCFVCFWGHGFWKWYRIFPKSSIWSIQNSPQPEF